MTFARSCFSALCLILLLASCGQWSFAASSVAPLGGFKIDPAGITVSGVSAGAYMAVQLDTAFSRTFRGAGSIAGGIYWCAKGDSQRAQVACMNVPSQIQSSEQIAEARRLAVSGEIDPLENLTSHRIYIYASPKDFVVNPVNSDKLMEFYGSFLDRSRIRAEHSVASAHGFPTLNEGGPCNIGMSPWILKCNFDGAGEIFQQLYGGLGAKGQADGSHLQQFSQEEFGGEAAALYPYGYVYVPSACARGESCRLHVALHGCGMNPDYIQDKFARLAGYNEWAETNRIIVLYPQSAKVAQANPYGCWDWFGFTGANYMTKNGPQMQAIKKMVDRLLGGKGN